MKVVRVFIENQPDQWHVVSGIWGRPSCIKCVDQESAKRCLGMYEALASIRPELDRLSEGEKVNTELAEHLGKTAMFAMCRTTALT